MSVAPNNKALLAEIDMLIGGIARTQAREIIAETFEKVPEDQIEGFVRQVVDATVERFRAGILATLTDRDANTAADSYRYHLVRECASISKMMVYEGGHA